MTACESERIFDVCALIGARGLCTWLGLMELEDLAEIALQQFILLILSLRLLGLGVSLFLVFLGLGLGSAAAGLAAGGSFSFLSFHWLILCLRMKI